MDLKKTVRLLVVDEQSDYFGELRQYAQMLDDRYNITCEFTDSSHTAQQILESWEPSVVLLDVHLSDMSNFDFLEDCQANAIPVVVTGHCPSREIERSVLSRGAIAYFPKSHDPDEMEEMMNMLAKVSSAGEYRH